MRFLLAGLLILAAACSRPKTGNVRIDPELLALVPSDAVLLAGGRIEAIRTAPLYEKYLAARLLPPFERFKAESGLDPRTDVSEFLAASDGKNSLAMLRGRFQTAALEKKLLANGAQSTPYRGRVLIGSASASVVFLDAETAVAGSAPALRGVVDRLGQRQSPPAALFQLLAAIPAEPHLWAVSLGGQSPFSVPERSNLANLDKVFESVDSLSVWADVASGLSLGAIANCRDQAAAKQVHAALRGFIGMGRLSTPDNRPELLRFYDAIDVRQEGPLVRLNAEFSQALIDQVAEHYQSLLGR